MHKRGITAAIVTGSTVLATALTANGGAASAATSLRAVPNSKPAWTAHSTALGSTKGTASVNARVYLSPKHGMAALKKFATAVSTPGSVQYRHFLSSAGYQSRFGTTDATVAVVSKYLKSSGLKVTGVAANNRYLTVKGNVAGAEKAFGAQIKSYVHNGARVQAPSSALTVPANLAHRVLTVTGLDTTVHKTAPASHQDAPPPAGFRNARPCSRYYGQVLATDVPKFRGQTLSYAPCGYTGPQFRAAYEGFKTTLDGSGVSVAITDAYASPTIKADASRYAETNGDGSLTGFHQTRPSSFTNQGQCGPSGWYGEETLDVEAVHAMAPGAKIHYYGAKSCFDDDFLDTLAQVVTDDDSQLVSNSWGDTGEPGLDTTAAYEEVFLQGASEGISFLFSSGDNGDEVAHTGIKQADYPASDPYVTAVGGTSTGIGGNGRIALQTAWGTHSYGLSGNSWVGGSYLYGAGGGDSALFNQPSYQARATSDPYRSVPDVAMDADPNTGMLIGETQAFSNGTYYDQYRIGGTSLASPLFAGMTALSVQNAGGGAGLLNELIYRRQPSFTDVLGNPADAGVVRVNFNNAENASNGLSYFVRTFDENGSLPATPGYDQSTGVGAPNPKWLSAIPAAG